jgi:flagellar basal-body rod modification protein FlgD
MANQISPVLAGIGPSSNTPQGSSKLGKDEFLRLLTTQLSNQDPLDPVDNQAFIAQLATFASVEQQSAMNSTLESLLVAQASSNQTNVAVLVGKEITFNSDQVALPTMGSVDIKGKLTDEAKKVSAIIKDDKGKVVRSIVLNGTQAAGEINLKWDGLNESGARVPQGNYTVTLTAEDAAGKSVPVSTSGRGRATGVSFAEGFPQLIVNGVRVRLSDVVEVNEPNTTTTHLYCIRTEPIAMKSARNTSAPRMP